MTLDQHRETGQHLVCALRYFEDELLPRVFDAYGRDSEAARAVRGVVSEIRVTRVGFDDLLWEEHRVTAGFEEVYRIYYPAREE